jgi:hypothetical protein
MPVRKVLISKLFLSDELWERERSLDLASLASWIRSPNKLVVSKEKSRKLRRC